MTIDPRLQAWLDGELGLEDLPDAMRSDAAVWTEVLEEVRATPAPGAAPGATAQIMSAIRSETVARPSPLRRLWAGVEWLARPRSFRVSPLAATAVLVLAAWAGLRLTVGGIDGETDPADDERVYVQFVMAAPGASTVALAGDFNEWDPTIELSDPDLDGIWSARVALEAGVHEYMFVIDGTEWRPDPHALSYAEDGFGQQNSVLAVAPLDQT